MLLDMAARMLFWRMYLKNEAIVSLETFTTLLPIFETFRNLQNQSNKVLVMKVATSFCRIPFDSISSTYSKRKPH